MSTSREESDDVSNGSLTKDQAPYLAHKEGYAEEDGEIIHVRDCYETALSAV